MSIQVEAAVKAHIWTVEQVGTIDSFQPTWIWLPYRVKEALANSIKGGLLTMIQRWGSSREWPHWTSTGIQALSELAGASDENWHKGTAFGEISVVPVAADIDVHFNGTYLEKWKKVAGHPERVVNACLREMRLLVRVHDWVLEEELGYGQLCGRRLNRDEMSKLAMDTDCGKEEWADVRRRLDTLHEEGNTRFDALDAKLIAKHICTGKRNIKSIFDYYKGGPDATVQAYCVKCKKKVEILGAQGVALKKHRWAIMGICPECGTRVFRFISQTRLEEDG